MNSSFLCFSIISYDGGYCVDITTLDCTTINIVHHSSGVFVRQYFRYTIDAVIVHAYRASEAQGYAVKIYVSMIILSLPWVSWVALFSGTKEVSKTSLKM